MWRLSVSQVHYAVFFSENRVNKQRSRKEKYVSLWGTPTQEVPEKSTTALKGNTLISCRLICPLYRLLTVHSYLFANEYMLAYRPKINVNENQLFEFSSE